MNVRQLFLLLSAAALLAACAHDSPPSNNAEPGFFGRSWESTRNAASSASSAVGKLNPFKRSPNRINEKREPNWRRLAFTMTVEPQPLSLGESRRMAVALRLENKTRRLVQLDFPTTQRIEVLLKTKDGKTIEKWSEDQAFEKEPGLVAINSGERLEYTAQVATRDMVAGQEYTVEGFFPNYPALHATATIVPEK